MLVFYMGERKALLPEQKAIDELRMMELIRFTAPVAEVEQASSRPAQYP